MTPINLDAVIDAIAQHLPDGIDSRGNWHGCRDILCEALGIKDEDDELYEVIQRLVKEGRLRGKTDHGFTVLSWYEQSRRIVAELRGHGIHTLGGSDIELIANVLAGKTEKL